MNPNDSGTKNLSITARRESEKQKQATQIELLKKVQKLRTYFSFACACNHKTNGPLREDAEQNSQFDFEHFIEFESSSEFSVLCHRDKFYFHQFLLLVGHLANVCLRAPPP